MKSKVIKDGITKVAKASFRKKPNAKVFDKKMKKFV